MRVDSGCTPGSGECTRRQSTGCDPRGEEGAMGAVGWEWQGTGTSKGEERGAEEGMANVKKSLTQDVSPREVNDDTHAR